MKLSLPLKLGIFVVLVFSVVIATCMLWIPVKVRHYTGKFKSENPNARIRGLEGLLTCGHRGFKVLSELLGGKTEEAKFITEYWGKLDDKEMLFKVVELGFIDSVKLLQDKGVDINVQGYNGWFPLHVAALVGQKEMCLFLLSEGANIEARDNMGTTPLQAAAIFKELETVVALIDKGANINAIGQGGKSVLDVSYSERRKEIYNLLLSHGAKTGEELRKEADKK